MFKNFSAVHCILGETDFNEKTYMTVFCIQQWVHWQAPADIDEEKGVRSHYDRLSGHGSIASTSESKSFYYRKEMYHFTSYIGKLWV